MIIPESSVVLNTFVYVCLLDWITSNLLQQIQGDETLAKRLTDPTFMAAITEFQTNPKGALEKYKNNAEVMQFLQSFCGLMGESGYLQFFKIISVMSVIVNFNSRCGKF